MSAADWDKWRRDRLADRRTNEWLKNNGGFRKKPAKTTVVSVSKSTSKPQLEKIIKAKVAEVVERKGTLWNATQRVASLARKTARSRLGLFWQWLGEEIAKNKGFKQKPHVPEFKSIKWRKFVDSASRGKGRRKVVGYPLRKLKKGVMIPGYYYYNGDLSRELASSELATRFLKERFAKNVFAVHIGKIGNDSGVSTLGHTMFGKYYVNVHFRMPTLGQFMSMLDDETKAKLFGGRSAFNARPLVVPYFKYFCRTVVLKSIRDFIRANGGVSSDK